MCSYSLSKKKKKKETHPNDSTTYPAKLAAVLGLKLQGLTESAMRYQPQLRCCADGGTDRAAAKTCSENRAGFPGTSLPEQPSGHSFSKELKTDGTRPGERGVGMRVASTLQWTHRLTCISHAGLRSQAEHLLWLTLHVGHMSMQGC